jgi:CheY-like chemotaxis protein
MGLRILLVDDDPVDLKLVKALLETDGHDVRVFSSWHLVPPAVFSERFDVALVDVILPGVHGDILVRRLKETQPGRRMPLLLVSSLPEPELVRAAAQSGADGWIRKPITAEALDAALGQLVPREG